MVKEGYSLRVSFKEGDPQVFKHFETINEMKTALAIIQYFLGGRLENVEFAETEFSNDDPFMWEIVK